MAFMFTSLCEFCSSCIVYQFNMFKTDASSVNNSASLFPQPFTSAIPKNNHSNPNAALPPTLNRHVSKGKIREFKRVSLIQVMHSPYIH